MTPRRVFGSAAVGLATLVGYGCHASSRDGLFNNQWDMPGAIRDHDVAWAARLPGRPTTLEVIRIVRAHGGACARSEPVYAPRIMCRVETPGRLSAMMPSSIVWWIELERAGDRWRLVGRRRGEIVL